MNNQSIPCVFIPTRTVEDRLPNNDQPISEKSNFIETLEPGISTNHSEKRLENGTYVLVRSE